MYDIYLKHLSKYGKMQTTIERINNNGHYSKENCKWATRSEQCLNRRKWKIKQERNLIGQWVKILGNLVVKS